MPSAEKRPSVKKSAVRASAGKRASVAKKKSIFRASAAKRASIAFSGERLSTAKDARSLPVIKVSGHVIDEYEVVSQPSDQHKPAGFAVLAWTGEPYDFELQRRVLPKLYLFTTKYGRDEFQQELNDTEPGLYLHAFAIQPAIRASSTIHRPSD